MADIKPLDQIAAKWVRQSGASAQSYQEGVQTPRRDWQRATVAANDAWKAGVAAASQRNAFASGVSATPTAAQIQAAATKGAARFGEGVASAQGKYAQRFAPYAQTIASTQLPPRGPRGSAQNLQRVAAIANALNQRRTSGRSGQ